MSVTCVDERIAPRVHMLSFRVPGACVFPRENEPSYTLAAILFFNKTAGDIYNEIRVVIADHGIIGKNGYFGCGMNNISESLTVIKEKLDEETNLSNDEIEEYLRRAQLYDLSSLGGIGKHAAWEVNQFKEMSEEFTLKGLLGRILPNDLAKEEIPNDRLVITQPFVNQGGMLENVDERGISFDGNTMIHTLAGKSNIKEDYALTNELLIFSYLKGETVREVLVLEPAMDMLEQSSLRRFLQRVQQTSMYSIKKISKQIAPIVNLPEDSCYQYLTSIKENASTCLYGSESDQLNRSRITAEEIKDTGLLSKTITCKYGLVDVGGKIKQLTIL